MRSLSDISLAEMLPGSVLGDPFVQGLIEGFDEEFHLLVEDTTKILLFAELGQQPHAVLDHLAWHFNVDFYDQQFSLEVKRGLIATALYWHSVKGTPRAVERAVEIVFGAGVVEEWFAYGGSPFHFRVRASGGAFPNSEKYERLKRMIETVKRKTAILESLTIEQSGQANLFIGGAMRIGQHTTIGSV